MLSVFRLEKWSLWLLVLFSHLLFIFYPSVFLVKSAIPLIICVPNEWAYPSHGQISNLHKVSVQTWAAYCLGRRKVSRIKGNIKITNHYLLHPHIYIWGNVIIGIKKKRLNSPFSSVIVDLFLINHAVAPTLISTIPTLSSHNNQTFLSISMKKDWLISVIIQFPHFFCSRFWKDLSKMGTFQSILQGHRL